LKQEKGFTIEAGKRRPPPSWGGYILVPTPRQKPLHLTRMEDGGTVIKGYLISYTVSALKL